MLETFWNSLELEDISGLNYTVYESYKTEEQRDNVIEKLDWVILKLHKLRDQRKYDYDVVVGLKNRIRYNGCSLTAKGIEFLNLITSDLKDDSF
jgi:hypothetical protein